MKGLEDDGLVRQVAEVRPGAVDVIWEVMGSLGVGCSGGKRKITLASILGTWLKQEQPGWGQTGYQGKGLGDWDESQKKNMGLSGKE